MVALWRLVLCWAWGHDAVEVAPCVDECRRCGAWVDLMAGPDWSERERYGAFDVVRVAWSRLRRLAVPRCDHCGRLMWFGRGEGLGSFCSKACHDAWLPF